jgi:hypothetical protein
MNITTITTTTSPGKDAQEATNERNASGLRIDLGRIPQPVLEFFLLDMKL